jgi:hypothetical protein
MLKMAGTNNKWPELEMGKNSVAPWIMPRMIASIIVIAAYCSRKHNLDMKRTDRRQDAGLVTAVQKRGGLDED